MQTIGDPSPTGVLIPFLLPHEVIGNLAKRGIFFNHIPSHMPELQTLRHKAALGLGLSPEEVTPIGFQVDWGSTPEEGQH